MSSPSLTEASESLARALREVGRGLVERQALVEIIALATVASEHVLVIGPPGTAKSEAVRRFSRAVQGRYFEYLLGRFTEPTEIFGPIDLKKLREGVVETEIAGMLPEAEIAFLDEVFQGSTAILNTLLGLLNERVFRRGHTHIHCPLRVCVGASNQLPQDDALAAFADRFLLRVHVDSIGESRLEELLEGGWSLRQTEPAHQASVAELDRLAAAARQADLSPIRPAIAHAVRLLRQAGVALSDRRVVKVQSLVAAAAALDGREQPTEADLWPLVLVAPTAESQAVARDALREFLAASQNRALVAAAEEASLGAAARAARLSLCGQELFEARPEQGADAEWKLALESVAREIDAGFARDGLPTDLTELRARIVTELDLEAGDERATAE